jgi:hypothetical protein
MTSTKKTKIYSVALDGNIDEILKKFQDQLANGETVSQIVTLAEEKRLVIVTEYEQSNRPINLLLEEFRSKK